MTFDDVLGFALKRDKERINPDICGSKDAYKVKSAEPFRLRVPFTRAEHEAKKIDAKTMHIINFFIVTNKINERNL